MTAFDTQTSSGILIAKYRRKPQNCLYCMSALLTTEHIVPEAIGGRLTADILCTRHNGIVNAADQHLSKTFAPFVTMLQVPRQRGGVGAEFAATDAEGQRITILAEGFAKQKPLVVHKRDEKKRILRATGNLDTLDALPKNAFNSDSPQNILAIITLPEARFDVVSDNSITGGILKIALHFYTGFVGGVSTESATALLPYIVGDKIAAGEFVRTPMLEEDAFPESWPPCHEVTAYPNGQNTIVTMLLFGAYAYTCRLPFAMSSGAGLRYRQTLGENYPEFQDHVPIPQSLDWDKRPGLGEKDAWERPVRARLERIALAGQEAATRARCRRAWEDAHKDSANIGDIWERYRSRLALEIFSSAEIEQIVKIGRWLDSQGNAPWKVPVAWGPDGENQVA